MALCYHFYCCKIMTVKIATDSHKIYFYTDKLLPTLYLRTRINSGTAEVKVNMHFMNVIICEDR